MPHRRSSSRQGRFPQSIVARIVQAPRGSGRPRPTWVTDSSATCELLFYAEALSLADALRPRPAKASGESNAWLRAGYRRARRSRTCGRAARLAWELLASRTCPDRSARRRCHLRAPAARAQGSGEAARGQSGAPRCCGIHNSLTDAFAIVYWYQLRVMRLMHQADRGQKGGQSIDRE